LVDRQTVVRNASRVMKLGVLLVVLAGCPYVPDGEVRGEQEVALGGTTQLRLYCDQLFGGWERVPCGHDWRVEDVPGGNATVGTVTSCGLYTAPAELPLEPPEISASECDYGNECADACGGGVTITLIPPP
jgi:hypothetical protein